MSPAPSARAIADATPPPIAPPDMVMVRITNGNTSAIAASDFDAEPADIGGLGDHHAGAGAERDHVRPRQPQQRAQDRTVDQRIFRARLRRRKRTLLFVDGYFGDRDIGQWFRSVGPICIAAPRDAS